MTLEKFTEKYKYEKLPYNFREKLTKMIEDNEKGYSACNSIDCCDCPLSKLLCRFDFDKSIVALNKVLLDFDKIEEQKLQAYANYLESECEPNTSCDVCSFQANGGLCDMCCHRDFDEDCDYFERKEENHPCGNCVYYGDECMEHKDECEFSENYDGEHSKSEYEEEVPVLSPEEKSFHSNHYCEGTIEPIEYIMANKMCFNRGNIIKYGTRAGKKEGQGHLDVKKIIDYAILLAFDNDIEITEDDVMQLVKYRFDWKRGR